MISNANFTISDDWGWFVDIETELYTNIIDNRGKKVINKLDSIKEDSIYYTKNYKDNESNFHLYHKEFEKNIDKKNTMYVIYSTTLITSILTYAIFFLI
jgi:hypothetical protein